MHGVAWQEESTIKEPAFTNVATDPVDGYHRSFQLNFYPAYGVESHAMRSHCPKIIKTFAGAEMKNHKPVCSLCGTNHEAARVVIGRNGAICTACLGEALAGLGGRRLTAQDAIGLDGGRRCLMCDSAPSDWRLVAYRPPFAICDYCLRAAFDVLMDAGETLVAVRF